MLLHKISYWSILTDKGLTIIITDKLDISRRANSYLSSAVWVLSHCKCLLKHFLVFPEITLSLHHKILFPSQHHTFKFLLSLEVKNIKRVLRSDIPSIDHLATHSAWSDLETCVLYSLIISVKLLLSFTPSWMRTLIIFAASTCHTKSRNRIWY